MIVRAWRQQLLPALGALWALVGLFSNHFSILAIGLFFWGLALLSAYVAHRTLADITVFMRVNPPHAEIDEATVMEMVVKNPLPWPILNVQWAIDLPPNLKAQGPGTVLQAVEGARQTIQGALWVGARQRVRIQCQLKGSARGRWNVGPGSLVFHDPLKWNELVRMDQQQEYLTVWPRRFPLPEGFWSQSPDLGLIKGNPWDSPDPFRVINIRPYQPGDPVRLIAPYPSARLRQLMVKQLEPMETSSVEVLIHPKTVEKHWHGINRTLLEDTVSAAASVVEAAIAARLVTGLSGTGSIPGHIRGFRFSAIRRTNPEELLTGLAWLQPSGTMTDDLDQVLAALGPRLTYRATLIVVSPYWEEAMTRDLQAKVLRGLKVIALVPGKALPAFPPWVHNCWRFSQGEWSRD